MARIPRRVHGILDYLTGILLMASPWLFGFADTHVPPMLALAFGGGSLLYSLFTDYELGLVRMIPFSVHLAFDLVVGLVLATNWLHFGIGGTPGVIFTAVGVMEIIVALFSHRGHAEKTAHA